jgi:hypothetical protein
VAQHQADLAWLNAELARPFDGQTVVVTHHAPIAPVPFTDLSAAYGSDLSQMILHHQPALWLYDHTHMPQADRVGTTEVRNVSLGYPERWSGRRDGLAEHVEGLVI